MKWLLVFVILSEEPAAVVVETYYTADQCSAVAHEYNKPGRVKSYIAYVCLRSQP